MNNNSNLRPMKLSKQIFMCIGISWLAGLIFIIFQTAFIIPEYFKFVILSTAIFGTLMPLMGLLLIKTQTKKANELEDLETHILIYGNEREKKLFKMRKMLILFMALMSAPITITLLILASRNMGN